MELKDTIEKRVSIRNFSSEEVPVKDLKEMARLASFAPSVNNYQPWNFTAISNKKVLSKMAYHVSEAIEKLQDSESKASKNLKSQVEWFATFFAKAPAVIALSMKGYETVLEKGSALTHEEINKQRNYPDIQSAGACIQNLLLAAVDMGYGACWVSASMIAREKLEGILQIEYPYQLIAFVAIGKPSQNIKPKQRKPIDDIFTVID